MLKLIEKFRRVVSQMGFEFFYPKGKNNLRVIITGPPRSGTSFLAGLVEKMGFNPGPKKWLKNPDQFNPYGYFECTPLMEIDHQILNKFGGSAITPPHLPFDWKKLCKKEIKEIYRIVEKGKLEMYKGNMLVVLADLYFELFPGVKWIFIHREESATAISIKNSSIQGFSIERSIEMRKKWIECWNKTQPSNNCLIVKYEDFLGNSNKMVSIISDYLGLNLSGKKIEECAGFFMPRVTKNREVLLKK